MDDTPVLRLVDRPQPGGSHIVVVSWQAPGVVPRETTVAVDVPIAAGVAEKLRWYLEDYGEFRSHPAPTLAAETERVVAALGRELFAAVFSTLDAATIWALAGLSGLDRVRIEIDADPGDVPGLPWELLRDLGTDRPLVVAAGQFVRTHRQAAGIAHLPDARRDELRVLLVICRPDGRDDVPFRSVASRLVRGGADRLAGLELDILRPATFPRLRQVLTDARDRGRPYDVVHFDGHGTYLDVDDDAPTGPSPLRYGLGLVSPARAGRHGYLLFEKPDMRSNQQLVDGSTLAGLLVAGRVSVLVLNACRSAYAEAPNTPAEGPDRPESATGVHDRIRAYGSLAAEVADAGVPGVVAMRYNVYVVTAAQFVADLYTQLLSGRTLGRAATVARQALAADPVRHIGAEPVALQDWVVPTVYEAVPLTLLTRAEAPPPVLITLRGPVPAEDGVPAGPDIGFLGRDESLLALDRAFDEHRVVLLHALAGAGKTTTAAEFARWYAATGGLGSGPILWTSFGHHLPLDRVLDVAGVAFAPQLAANGITWAAVTDRGTRRDLVLQVLAQVPALWVWDNVEPVAGFPDGAPSAWTPDEQQELLDFLRALKTDTRTKVLLTSRRTEQRWLDTVAVRVGLPPMPMRERLQLTHALIRHLAPDTPPGGGVWQDIDWRQLLRFTGGNPLTITVTIRQALREQITVTQQVAAFVDRLQAGTGVLESGDDAALGRDRSLAASLSYGFTHAFTDRERAVLALLHLFRDTVDVDALRSMGDPDTVPDDAVPVLAGAGRDELGGLLARAVDVGLLTDEGDGHFGVHPALPWFFTGLFHEHVAAPGSAERAYTRAVGRLGRTYFDRVEQGGSTRWLPVLRLEEPNLLHALHLARTHELHGAVEGCLQGLKKLHDLTGRDGEWARLVAGVEGDYIDPATKRPRPGREDNFTVLTGYRVQIAQARRDWPTATRLQTALTTWLHERAGSSPDLRNLAVAEQHLGRLLVEQDDPASLDHYQAAHDLAEQAGDTALQAMQASSLGNVYLTVSGLQDLDQAQRWHERSLALTPEHDRIGRAAEHASLATIAYQRFLGGRLPAQLDAARSGYLRALDLLPDDHHDYRAGMHNQLGNVHAAVGEVPQAMQHYQQSLRHKEDGGDRYGAGNTRYNIALLLADADRGGDALLYARAAVADFREVGFGAEPALDKALALIDLLEQ